MIKKDLHKGVFIWMRSYWENADIIADNVPASSQTNAPDASKEIIMVFVMHGTAF